MQQISQRVVMGVALAFLGMSLIHAQSTESIPPEEYTDPEAADSWIATWVKGQRDVKGALLLQRFADRTYIVTREISWTPSHPDALHLKPVTVPAGFVTDFASVPRIFWSRLPPDGDYGYAAIIHDYLYWMQPGTRDAADTTLLFAMQEFDVNSITQAFVYSGVRVGGWGAWSKNAKLKATGEKRVLKKYPEDPTVRWSDWKKRPDVF